MIDSLTPEDPCMCASMKTVSDGFVMALTLGDTADGASTEADALIEQTADQGDEAFVDESSEWWSTYWSRTPLVLLEIWRRVFINEGLTTVYLPRFHGVSAHRYGDINSPKETKEIMQLEGTAACVSAIVEMLVHTHGGVTKIFPATSSEWKDVSFRDVPQPGGFSVSAQRKGGATERVSLSARREAAVKLEVGDRDSMRMTDADGERTVQLPLEMHLRPGETVSFTNL